MARQSGDADDVLALLHISHKSNNNNFIPTAKRQYLHAWREACQLKQHSLCLMLSRATPHSCCPSNAYLHTVHHGAPLPAGTHITRTLHTHYT